MTDDLKITPAQSKILDAMRGGAKLYIGAGGMPFIRVHDRTAIRVNGVVFRCLCDNGLIIEGSKPHKFWNELEYVATDLAEGA